MAIPAYKNKLGVRVEVLEYGPQAWYLLRDGQQLYLDVDCNHSFAYYSFTMRLNSDEAAQYWRRVRAYLDELARAIQHSAPGVSGSRSIYKDRLVVADTSTKANEAIQLWLAGRRLNFLLHQRNICRCCTGSVVEPTLVPTLGKWAPTGR